MKLSLAWIFDHIDIDWKEVDLSALVSMFNTTTAEIESTYKIAVDLSSLSLATVVELDEKKAVLFSAEWNKQIVVPRPKNIELGSVFMITKNGLATTADFKSEKTLELPALYCSEKELTGLWKEQFESEDHIIVVDNKSITHRPDLWSHRGFAREMAAILNVKFLPIEQFVTRIEQKQYESIAQPTGSHPFTISLAAPEVKHFASLYVSDCKMYPSVLKMVNRLAKIDGRSINAVVDATNYIMFDFGQPMHAFDASAIVDKKITARFAHAGEKIVLLDDKTVELDAHDLVIADGKGPIALAGIKGGNRASVTSETESIFLEAANFDAVTIRKTSARLKIRTDGSMRWEKSVDPYLNCVAIERFARIMSDYHIPIKFSETMIVAVGRLPKPQVIEISHTFIQDRLGIVIAPNEVKKIVEKLGFALDEQSHGKEIVYKITVPTWRGTKDITIKEDILEEIVRFYGYDKIVATLPERLMSPNDLSSVYVLRAIKRHLSYALAMHELVTYSLNDESFLKNVEFKVHNPITLKNPVSQEAVSLVPSLVPHLVKAVVQNESKEEHLRFFETARIWSFDETTRAIQEQKSIAGIFFDRSKKIDFYDIKAELATLFDLLELPLSWSVVPEIKSPWYSRYQTACLMHGKTVVGMAGMLDSSFVTKLSVPGQGFVFELNADFLLTYKAPVHTFVPLPKYQSSWLDVSMLVPLSLTAAVVADTIKDVDARITDVSLIDFFEKEDLWKDKRSLTFRYYVQDLQKTLEHDEINAVSRAVVSALTKLGVTIR